MIMTWFPPLAYLAGSCVAYDSSFLAPARPFEHHGIWTLGIAAVVGCMVEVFPSTSRRLAMMAVFAMLLSVVVSQAVSLAYFKIIDHFTMRQAWSLVPSRSMTLCISTHAVSLVLAFGRWR